MKAKKWLAFAMGVLTMVSACACAPQGETDDPISDGEYVAPIVPDTVVRAGGSYLLDSGKTIGFLSSEIEPMADGAEVEGLTVQLTATVEPADAWNKEVDWSFAWAEDAPTEWRSKPAENYIKIEPLADGSTTANVTLTDYFHACAITITVTTRDGGFTASCDATCVSEYYETKITMQGSIAGTDSFGRQYYELYSGKKLNFTYKNYNKFGYESNCPGTLAIYAYLTPRGVANNIEEDSRIQAGYWQWSNVYGKNKYFNNIDGSKHFAFYGNPNDSDERVAEEYCRIYIDEETQSGNFSYNKAFDTNYIWFTGSWWAYFTSFEPVYPQYSFGGIEFSFWYSPPSGGYGTMATGMYYVKLRTSVKAVSLSASNLALR